VDGRFRIARDDHGDQLRGFRPGTQKGHKVFLFYRFFGHIPNVHRQLIGDQDGAIQKIRDVRLKMILTFFSI